jgi:hypothetical protein
MKDFKLIEHTLIPASLFALNMSVVHLLYLLSIHTIFSLTSILVLLATAILIAGVSIKKKILMIAGTLIYFLSVLLSF